MNVTIKRGPNASALLGTFLSDVQYIPGVGKTRATSIHAGAVLTVTVPPDKIEGAVRNLRRLHLDGTLVVDGLPGENAGQAETKVEAKVEAKAGSSNAGRTLADAFNEVLANAVSEDTVRAIVTDQINTALAGIPTVRIELERKGLEPIELEGLHHPCSQPCSA